MPTTARDVLRVVADRTLAYDFTIWFWGDAIAVDGLLEATAILSDDQYRRHVARYVERWARQSLTWVDHLTPGVALVRLVEDGLCQPESALALAKHLVEEVPRAAGAPLYRPDQPEYRHAVWVDTIYHVPPFFAELAKLTGDNAWYDRALAEWRAHTALLSSPSGPFLAHTYDTGARRLHGYGWGRGSGWALLGMIDTLALLPDHHPGREAAVAETRALAEAVLAVQDDTGFWHTLLQDRESYLESSTAAFFGAAFTKGVRLRLLGDEFAAAAERAWEAVCNRVGPDGGFWGVSACTWASVGPVDPSMQYHHVPTEVNVWGQGSALRHAAERVYAGLD